MLTIRKAVILIGTIFFLFLFFLRPSTKSPSIVRHQPVEQQTESKPNDDAIERILAEANRPLKRPEEFETLRDHLAYLYPYAGPHATKFPAYIWQTWKYTPAMGEFDEKFRMTEASWTEKHPEYVHEVTLFQKNLLK